MTRGRLALVALGIGLSALAIVALLRAARAADVAEHLRATRLEWLVAGMVVTAFGYVLRSYRWRALLAPQRKLPLGRVFGPTVMGFLAINTLPARIGEFVRAYLLARLERLPTAGVLGTCAMERVLDLFFLALFWALSLSLAPLPAWFRVSGYVVIGLGGVGAAVLWFFQARAHIAERLLDGNLLSRLPAALREGLRNTIPAFGVGFRTIAARGVLSRAVGWSALMWVTNAAVFSLVGFAVGLQLPWWSGLLLSFIVCVAILVPSSPGFVGVMEAACVVGLAILGVDSAAALAYGMLYHATQIVPLVLLGGFWALRTRGGAQDSTAQGVESPKMGDTQN